MTPETKKGTSPAEINAIHAKAVELGKLSLKMTAAAGSGHPSSALALSHIVVELMYRRMRYDLRDPWNPGNDRLVLSVGHAVPIVYAAYADLGGVVGKNKSDARSLTIEDLETFRELASVLDGHPNPAEGFPFFDAATGSLGQGLSVAAGLAAAARLDCIDKRIYCIVGDGEAREGQVWEAADFVVDHHLSKLCAVFSCNGHGQAGPTSAQQSADALAAKLTAFQWKVFRADGHDPRSLASAFDHAETTHQPAAIVATTVKGWGVDLMVGKNYHGKPLADSELQQATDQLEATGARLSSGPVGTLPGPPSPVKVPAQAKHREISLPTFEEAMKREGLQAALEKKKYSTRGAYGVALAALGHADTRIVSLDADVSNSTYADRFAKQFAARFFECKIAEQNMVSAAAGLAAGGQIPFASSFGKFLARAADQIDMAAISRANIKLVGSHCGVSLAADGPSQMAVSDVGYVRTLTHVDNGRGDVACHLFHPSDAVSAYRLCELMANIDGMCYLRTHRPDARFLYSFDEKFEVRGCKQLRKGGDLTLVGSGYILHNVLAATEELAREKISCNVFDAYTLPLDAGPILNAARQSKGMILCVEDNYVGGVGSEIAEAAAVKGDIRVVSMTAGRIPKSAKTAEEVFAYVGVGLEQIVAQARSLAGR